MRICLYILTILYLLLFFVARYDAIDAIIIIIITLYNKFRFIVLQSSWLVYLFTLRCRR